MLAFACRWTTAALPAHKVSPETLYPALKDGLLLCDLLALVMPELEFRGLHLKARTRKTCIENIEQALSEVWRRRGTLPARVICTADEIYEGILHQRKIHKFFQEFFEHFVIRELRPHSKTLLDFFDSYLSLFGWSFSRSACSSPCRRGRGGLAAELSSCVRFGLLLCLADALDVKEFARACFGRPQSNKELMHNARFILGKLRDVHIPCLLDEHDFVNVSPAQGVASASPAGSSELMLLQLHALYESLVSDAALVLPPVDDRDRIAAALGLGSTLSDEELASLRFRDGVSVVKVERDDVGEVVEVQSSPQGRMMTTPKSGRFISIFDPHDGQLVDPRTKKLVSVRMTARYLESTEQCTFQFWPKVEEPAETEPLLVFDLATMRNIKAYRDAFVREGLKIEIETFGLLKDDYRLVEVKGDLAEIKLVPDDWHMYVLEQLEKLKRNYSKVNESIH
jgi:hypothetical protein